jgi:hypothetical protein
LRRVPARGLAGRLVDAVREEAAEQGAGRLGVIVPVAARAGLGAAVARAVSGTAVGDEPDLDCRVVVLTVAQARGLEFDSVIVVDPAAILAESPRGRSDLYVALTRATQRLGILHPGRLPAELDGPVSDAGPAELDGPVSDAGPAEVDAGPVSSAA